MAILRGIAVLHESMSRFIANTKRRKILLQHHNVRIFYGANLEFEEIIAHAARDIMSAIVALMLAFWLGKTGDTGNAHMLQFDRGERGSYWFH